MVVQSSCGTIPVTFTKMKFLVVAFALLACAYADVSELGYDYPQPAAPAPAPVVHEELSLPIAPVAPQNTYIPPPQPQPIPQPQNSYVPPPQPQNTYVPPPPPQPAPQPQNTYVPPPPPAPVVHEELSQPIEVPQPAPVVPQNTYIPPAPVAPAPVPQFAPVEIEQHADDGYRYKTVRRRVFRNRA